MINRWFSGFRSVIKGTKIYSNQVIKISLLTTIRKYLGLTAKKETLLSIIQKYDTIILSKCPTISEDLSKIVKYRNLFAHSNIYEKSIERCLKFNHTMLVNHDSTQPIVITEKLFSWLIFKATEYNIVIANIGLHSIN